jgi:outer membrane autotransporter protein
VIAARGGTAGAGRSAAPGKSNGRRWFVGASALALAVSGALSNARADDVDIEVNTGPVNLDAEIGATVRVFPDIDVGGDQFTTALRATISAWTLNNEGNISGFNGVVFEAGGSVTNTEDATIEGEASGVVIGKSGGSGAGFVENFGIIIGNDAEGVTLLNGGTIINHQGAEIRTDGLNAASVGAGTERTIVNSGSIVNDGTSYTYASGVLIQGGAGTLTNNATGEIHGRYNGVYASGSAPLLLTNHGSVTSIVGPAIELDAGSTVTNTGTIQSAGNGLRMAGSAAGSVTNSGTIGSTGSGLAIQFAGTGTRTLTLQTGSVLNGNVQGRSAAADHLTLEGTASESIAKFLNFETLSMQGSDWTLTGVGSFSTSALVGTGLLSVNGTLTSPLVTVDPLARLGGSGTIVGAVTNRGTLAAGNSIGTLSVQGSVTFEAGSTLETEVNAAGQTDLVTVTGAATINGGNVSVLAASGSYAPSTQYTIVSTTAGRTGVFSGVTSNLAFLAPSLTYDANNVYLTLVNNGIDFDAIGGTPNQRAAGSGVQGLGTGNPIYDAVLVLDIPGARYAFDQLSGEIHASAASVLIDDSRHVREAALGRLRDDLGEASGKPGLWAQAYGAQTDLDGDGNAADLGYDSAGLFAGMDGEFGNAWQAGALIGYSRASFDVDARSSSGSADSFHLAAYGGGEWGGLGLRAGAAYAWHDIETARAIVFQAYADSAAAAYDSHTAQAFGEVSYALQAGAATFEPTAALAYVDVGTDGFTENGGDAVLSSSGASADTTYSTLGVRARTPFHIGGLKAQASAFLGWQHAFGDTVPTIDLAFAGSNPFGIAGVPIAEDAALVDLGLDIRAGASSKLGIAYSGQFGDGATAQSFKAAFSLSF